MAVSLGTHTTAWLLKNPNAKIPGYQDTEIP